MKSYADIEDVGHSIAKCLIHIKYNKKTVIIITGTLVVIYMLFHLGSEIIQV